MAIIKLNKGQLYASAKNPVRAGIDQHADDCMPAVQKNAPVKTKYAD
jgi:hypothetical protein